MLSLCFHLSSLIPTYMSGFEFIRGYTLSTFYAGACVSDAGDIELFLSKWSLPATPSVYWGASY